MAYNENIPATGSKLNASRQRLEDNFGAIKSSVEKNHVAFNDGDEGKHKFLQMPQQSSAPSTAANEGALYTKDVSGATQLFWRPESDGTEVDFTSATKVASSGTTTLPSGIILKWGTGTVGENSTKTATFSTAFSTVFTCVVSLNSSGFTTMDKALTVHALTNSAVTVRNANGTGGNRTFYYQAIGI